MIALAQFLKRTGYRPDKVQDFIPRPMDIATCMYYTGIDPITGEEVYVPRGAGAALAAGAVAVLQAGELRRRASGAGRGRSAGPDRRRAAVFDPGPAAASRAATRVVGRSRPAIRGGRISSAPPGGEVQEETLRIGESITRGLSQFSFDENGTVPFRAATVILSPIPRPIRVGCGGGVCYHVRRVPLFARCATTPKVPS